MEDKFKAALQRIARQKPRRECHSIFTGSPERFRCQACGLAAGIGMMLIHADDCAYKIAVDALKAA